MFTMSTARAAPRAARSTAPRLRQICLAAPTLAPGVDQLLQLFGLGAAYDDPHVANYGLANAALAVGHTDGGDAWDGPYAPAGPQSQPQIRLDRATGIAGVALRGADASALAARWAALVGVAATADAQGRLQLLLPGGFIAFEAAAPGEADGLTDIVLQAVDPAAVLHQAASLDVPVTASGRCATTPAPASHCAAAAATP